MEMLKIKVKNQREHKIEEGISFTSFVTSMMQATMAKYEVFVKHAPFLEKDCN
jgi:hypothetical protein